MDLCQLEGTCEEPPVQGISDALRALNMQQGVISLRGEDASSFLTQAIDVGHLPNQDEYSLIVHDSFTSRSLSFESSHRVTSTTS